MRRGPRAFVVLLALFLALGLDTLPIRGEEEQQPVAPSAWNTRLLDAVERAHVFWREREIRIEAVRVFPRQMLITITASKATDLTWARDTMRSHATVRPHVIAGTSWLSLGPNRTRGERHEADLLIEADRLDAGTPHVPSSLWRRERPEGDLRAKAAKALRPANVELLDGSSGLRPVEREGFEALRLRCKPASAQQFLVALRNLVAFGYTFVPTARWDRESEAEGSRAPGGLGTIEFVAFETAK